MGRTRVFKPFLMVGILATGHLLAADFSGRWAGTFETNGSRVPIYLTLIVNSEGKIGGFVAIGKDTKQALVGKAELNSDELSLEVNDNANHTMRFRLTLTNGVLLPPMTFPVPLRRRSTPSPWLARA